MLGLEPRTSRPRDAPTRPEPTHINIVRLARLLLASPLPLRFSFTSVTARSSLFLQLEHPRIARLVSRLTTPIAPRGHPPSGSHCPQNARQSSQIREFYRQCRRTRMFIGRSFAPFIFSFLLLAHPSFRSVLVPYISRLNKYACAWPH